MNMKSRATHVEKNIKYCMNIDKTNLWSRSTTSKDVISNIEGILTQYWIIQKEYNIVQVAKNIYWLLSKISSSDGTFTKIEHICIVIISEAAISCSCCCYEKNGYQCTHIMIFIFKLLPRMLILRYQKDYYYFFGENELFNIIYKDILVLDNTCNTFHHYNCIETKSLQLTDVF